MEVSYVWNLWRKPVGLVFLLVNLILGKNLRKKLVQEYGERKSK